MGYTHYWEDTSDIDIAEYNAAIKDIAKIVKAKVDILANGHGDEGSKPGFESDIWFNGQGDDSHETFYLPKDPAQFEKFSFCKTAQKPYDVVVVACLTRLAEVDGIKVSSDGSAGDWEEGVKLASDILGRKLENPIKG